MRRTDPAFLVVATEADDVIVSIERTNRVDLLQPVPAQKLSRFRARVRQVRVVATGALQLRFVSRPGRLQRQKRARASAECTS